MTILDKDLPFLGPEFDAESWEYLQTTLPRIAEKLEQEIAAGRKPDEIYKACIRLLPQHRHETLCVRILQASRYLYAEMKLE